VLYVDIEKGYNNATNNKSQEIIAYVFGNWSMVSGNWMVERMEIGSVVMGAIAYIIYSFSA
jgi:pyocin large subunit-like protein